MQELAAEKQQGNLPILANEAYRAVGGFPFANPKFLKVATNAFKAKRGYLTPADVAFVDLCVGATLRATNLKAMDSAEETYRASLTLTKAHLGKHVALGELPEGKRPPFIVIGSG